MFARLAVDPEAVPGFVLKDGIIRYQDRVWIADDAET